MTNAREIPSLTKYSLKAFLRARKDLNFETTFMYDAVIEQEISESASDFLNAIADANPNEVKNFLEICPKLSVLARGTVTTVSGYTYKDVTPVQLLYLMHDNQLFSDVVLPYIQKLPPDMIKTAQEQLSKKIVEVENQRALFKPYDFSKIANAVSADKTLRKNGQPNDVTQLLLAQFKTDFAPGIISYGKSWIKEQLKAAFLEYANNEGQQGLWWMNTQSKWFLINVVGHLQTLVEKCFEQESSQKYVKKFRDEPPNLRSNNIKYRWSFDDSTPLPYRGSNDLSLILGRDFFVDILSGEAGLDSSTTWEKTWYMLDAYLDQKESQWKMLNSYLNNASMPQIKCDPGF